MDRRQSQTNSPQQQFNFQQHNMSQQPSPSPQQAHDANPQDVLAEARKNLQCLIDSGLSKELLHQLVDGSQALNLNLSAMNAMQAMPTIPSQPQRQTPFNQPTNPNHNANSASLAPPPPMRCPPPPPVASSVPSVQSVTTAPSTGSSTATTPTPSAEIKHEVLPEDVNCASSHLTFVVNFRPLALLTGMLTKTVAQPCSFLLRSRSAIVLVSPFLRRALGLRVMHPSGQPTQDSPRCRGSLLLPVIDRRRRFRFLLPVP